MDQDKLKERVTEIYALIDVIAREGHFLYDSRMHELIDELTSLRSICEHDFKNNVCTFCGEERAP